MLSQGDRRSESQSSQSSQTTTLSSLSFQVPAERTVSPRLSLFPVLCHHTRPAFCYRRTRDRREGGRERGPKGNFSCFVVVLCRAQPPLPRWAIRLVGGIRRSNGGETPRKGFEMESRDHGTSLVDHRPGLLFNEPCSFLSLPSAVVGRWKQMAWFGYVESSSSRRPSVRPGRERERGMADIYKACLPNFYLESVSWSQLGNGGKELQYLKKSRLGGRRE